MGRNKALLPLGDKPLVSLVAKTLLKVVDNVVVVIGHRDEEGVILDVLPQNQIKVVRDKIQLQSPVVGILTAMDTIRTDYATVVPCDTPFIKPQMIHYMFSCIGESDAVVPRRQDGRIEPLHTIFLVEPTRKAAQEALDNGELKVEAILRRLRDVNYISTEDLRKFDQELSSFFNVNTPEDLEKAITMFKVLRRVT